MAATPKSLGRLVARAGLVGVLAMATIVVVPEPGVVLAAERTIVSGTADSTNVLGARWRKVPFDALSTGTASFRLEWTGFGLLHFNIFHSNGTLVGGNYGSTPSPKLGDLPLVAGQTYSARVWSSSGVGVFELTVDENVVDTSPPSTPDGLRAGAIGPSSIEIVWDPSVDDNSVSSYEVYRDAGSVGSTPTETFTDVGLLPETTYAYTVRAFDPTGNASDFSNAFNVTTLSDGVVQERTIVSGTADSTSALGARWRKVDFDALSTGTASFRLEWTGSGLLHFNIFHSNGTLVGGNYGSTPSPKSRDLPLVAGETYSARVWSSSGVGVFELTVFERQNDASPPSTPENVLVTAETFQSISLAWDPSVDDDMVSSYEVYRDGDLAGSSATEVFTDVGLLPGMAHMYTVRALDPAGNASAFSEAVTGTTPPDVTAPSTPTNVQVTSEKFQSISLAWDPSVDDDMVSAYEVYRDDELAGSTATEEFTDVGLSPDTTYSYGVRALDRSDNPSASSTPITGTTTSEADRQPNIIVINTDDQRRDSIDYLPKIKQWMSDGGTTFTNGYVSTPSCCPSRSTLMSGRYIHNNGQFGQQTLGFDQDLTVQRYLQDNGYFTGHSGKYLHWLSTGVVAPYWDRWTYFKGGYIDVWMRFDDVSRRSSGYSTTITFDRALEYLDDFESRDDDAPFYLQLTPVAPHSPYTPEAQYADAPVPPHVMTPAHDETDRSDKPQWVIWRTRTDEWIANTRRQMIRTLYSVDDQVDRLMLRLEQLGELDDTLVIFTSDNGYQWGEHQLGSKFLPYTYSVGVPFLIRWPGHVEAGVVDDRFVTHVDIAPTILAAAGVTQDHVPLDGHDILSGHDREFAFTEYYYDVRNGNSIVTWAAIENDEYIYIEYYDQSRDRVTPTYLEYYDMVDDPYQLENLFDDGTSANDPDAAALSAQLASVKDCVGTACP